ncbi:hypothetical protein B0T10DRAFT_17001 [Thelonectria olida]|uniref:Uncharacterized protein n=1 Tax=Thelonectria olida TaxID=1576542 RepID=A0A9P8WLU4_9HYPO|nr:hypothetical protein B0T10DRAFT_17001 [Thelonectria olida]
MNLGYLPHLGSLWNERSSYQAYDDGETAKTDDDVTTIDYHGRDKWTKQKSIMGDGHQSDRFRFRQDRQAQQRNVMDGSIGGEWDGPGVHFLVGSSQQKAAPRERSAPATGPGRRRTASAGGQGWERNQRPKGTSGRRPVQYSYTVSSNLLDETSDPPRRTGSQPFGPDGSVGAHHHHHHHSLIIHSFANSPADGWIDGWKEQNSGFLS